MTSEAQARANPENAKKSTGPKSAEGRKNSSRNAVTHGARSAGLIGEDERSQYESFLAELRRYYPSKNPLVSMQLDRIARATVYVDRIQSVIDATYLLAQDQQLTDDSLSSLLNLDPNELGIAAGITRGELTLDDYVDAERLAIAAEVSRLNVGDLRNHEDFLEHAPKLCAFLHREATRFEQDIDTYISFDTNPAPHLSRAQDLHLKKVFESRQAEIAAKDTANRPKPKRTQKTFDEAMAATNIESLQDFTRFMQAEFERVMKTHQKLVTFSALRGIKSVPSALDLNTLDRLHRYQVTAQRQLSTFVGELLQLVK